jgi:hypothetical protein
MISTLRQWHSRCILFFFPLSVCLPVLSCTHNYTVAVNDSIMCTPEKGGGRGGKKERHTDTKTTYDIRNTN